MRETAEHTFTPHEINLDNALPTVCIIGSGLSGLLTAIEVKEQNTSLQVIILDKPQAESNTQISGMRIRAKRAASNARTEDERMGEVITLLGGQNNGVITAPMREFAQLLSEELMIWNQRLSRANPDFVHELPEWFGPQWGKVNQSGNGGRGESVLEWLRSIASNQGVKFLLGEACALHEEHGTITSVNLTSHDEEYAFRPDVVVLANGSSAGSLFNSTNKSIKHSATQLIFDAGLPLEGGTLAMWHPFGHCRSNGSPAIGCYETDNLERTNVLFMDGTRDDKTTKLLQEHKAHYHFKEISKRFHEKGGVVRLIDDTNGEQKLAQVSLHYSHLGAQTIDGTRVNGTTNLAVVGDAGGLLHWTNYQARLPGFALAHCLVSARKASDWVGSLYDDDCWTAVENGLRLTEVVSNKQGCTPQKDRLREINTRHMLQMEFGDEDARKEQVSSWKTELEQTNPADSTTLLSLAIVEGWERLIDGEQEPIHIGKELVTQSVYY